MPKFPPWVVDAMSEAPPLLTLQMCADVAGLPVAEIAAAVEAGSIFAVRPQGQVRVPRLSLAEWLASLGERREAPSS